MILWALAFLCLVIGIRNLFSNLPFLQTGLGRQRLVLKRVSWRFQEFEELLSAGLVPSDEDWNQIRELPDPWGSLAFESLRDLRSQGGAMLPTLKRFRSLAQQHDSSLADAKAKSAQAFAQALICFALVPVFSGALYLLLPGVSEYPWKWGLASGFSLVLALTGALWILYMAEMARWCGLRGMAREWILLSQCTGEKFLALVRSGTPSDLAWIHACELLSKKSPDLALEWGRSVWGQGEETDKFPRRANLSQAGRQIIEAGYSLRKAIQVSLMEGRPCTDRVETALHALRQEMKAQSERELSLLGTRALKPLFLCVAPSILGLLLFGLWLTWQNTGAPL